MMARHRMTRRLLGVWLIAAAGCVTTGPQFATTEKIDAHVHIRYSGPEFLDQAEADHFRALVVVNDHYDIAWQESYIADQKALDPDRFAYCASFTMQGWDEPDWQHRTIEHLKTRFDRDGAIAVKVWKNIGMVDRDAAGNFVMIDDPKLDLILDFIQAEDKTLCAHIGEPKDCWLPLDEMIANRGYYEEHPEYHMYLHPENPSYDAIMDSLDRMLDKHPGLRVVGAHLASIEWSVEELAAFLDKHPNLAVDTAERFDDLQHLDRDAVRRFFIDYQDRILYGTDLNCQEMHDPVRRAREAHDTWVSDWLYLATDIEQNLAGFEAPVRGLNLPPRVLRKVYYENAKTWYPGL